MTFSRLVPVLPTIGIVGTVTHRDAPAPSTTSEPVPRLMVRRRYRCAAAWLGRYACWMPKGSHLGGDDPLALLYTLIVFAAALFLPVLLARFVSSPGPSNSDSNEGGEGGLRRPPSPPAPSPGGAPLDNAQPARVRLRDDRRLQQRLPARQRRPAREPTRKPVRRSPTS